MGKEMREHFRIPYAYAAWSKDSEIRFESTSGGAFNELASVVLEKGGLVAGAIYNEECLVQHVLIDRTEYLENLRQSKYMSSKLGQIYRDIRKALEEKRLVCFCGSPCQVAGLNSFLQKDYDNLITIDFICRGMNSPKAFKAWLKEEEHKANSKAKRVWFKYKDGGWKSSPWRTRIDYTNGNNSIIEGDENLFMAGYLTANIYIRPSCGKCKFKGMSRLSDITLADYWKADKSIDDDKGTSLILVNSLKGQQLLEETSEKLYLYARSFEEAVSGNPMFYESVVVSDRSHSFLIDLDHMGFTEAFKMYGAYINDSKENKKLSIIRRIMKRFMGIKNG